MASTPGLGENQITSAAGIARSHQNNSGCLALREQQRAEA